MTGVSLSMKQKKQKAGHQEILGETLAKFEFFQKGWHPYSRFLDVDKVDLILRGQSLGKTIYREIQVKFGKLYECKRRWENRLFSETSWRFFTEKNLHDMEVDGKLFLCYVMSPDKDFQRDIFIFPVRKFTQIVRKAPRTKSGKYNVYISKSRGDPPRWYLRRKSKFERIEGKSAIDVTRYYLNFKCLGAIDQ